MASSKVVTVSSCPLSKEMTICPSLPENVEILLIGYLNPVISTLTFVNVKPSESHHLLTFQAMLLMHIRDGELKILTVVNHYRNIVTLEKLLLSDMLNHSIDLGASQIPSVQEPGYLSIMSPGPVPDCYHRNIQMCVSLPSTPSTPFTTTASASLRTVLPGYVMAKRKTISHNMQVARMKLFLNIVLMTIELPWNTIEASFLGRTLNQPSKTRMLDMHTHLAQLCVNL